MAKNLFEQLLTKAGEIWSGPKTRDDSHIYIQDSSGLSGVAKYLAKQEKAAQVEQTTAPVSGVEKYLAKQQASSPKAAAETPTTGVGKYLARQSSTTSTPRKEPVVVPKTGVGKYLAGVSIADATKAKPVAEKKQPQTKKAEATKTPAPAKKAAPVKAKPAVTPSIKTPEPAKEKPAAASAPASGMIKFENISQCHASTVKGTQCKNTTNLTKIQRTINKKKYQFCTCAQHNNDTFKPYQPLLEM